MVKSIQFWGDAFGVVEGSASEGVNVTAFGQQLLEPAGGFDPYLEDLSSLWLLHWTISTRANLGAWNTLFCDLRDSQFSRKRLAELAMKRARQGKSTISPKTIDDHVRILLSTYTSGRFEPEDILEESLGSPLQELGLLRESDRVDGEAIYAFEYGPKSGLTPGVFAHAVSDYWNATAAESATLSLRDITYGLRSPGSVFRLDEDSIVSYLKEIGTITKSSFRFMDTPDVRMLSRRTPKSSWTVLPRDVRP
jgi:hypothetical protein